MNQISASPATSRLGPRHGYQFAGDFVRLNAEVHFSGKDLLAAQSWALQLWANTTNALDPAATGIKVAELAVTPQPAPLLVDGDCLARLPAGRGEQSLSLALVTWGSDGLPQIRDQVAYARAESFAQPEFHGQVACCWSDDGLEVQVEGIGNPRAPDNLSGTLALEVWALDMPYTGGSWQGVPVATFILGVLAGGEAWRAGRHRAAAIRPGKAACLTVMLREWTAEGYLTRDFRNLPADEPLLASAQPAAEQLVAAEPALAGPLVTAAKPELKAEAGKVSVNSASEEELFALKGVSTSLARHIVASRPYASLDELCRAKGMGPKLLLKLRHSFCL